MTDRNGWPDPARPGVPLNPEWDGAHHWLSYEGEEPGLYEWDGKYWKMGGGHAPMDYVVDHFTYIGPVLTPTEVEARVSEAMKWRDAINDALTNWLLPIEDHETPKDALQRLIRLEVDAALDPKVSQSAADLVAKARRDALEEAAQRAAHYERMAYQHGHLPVDDPHECAAQVAREIETSIRALKG
jgi:hypothetical protein